MGTYYGAPQLTASLCRRVGRRRVSPSKSALRRSPPVSSGAWSPSGARSTTCSATATRGARSSRSQAARSRSSGIDRSGIASTALVAGRNATVIGIVKRAYPTSTDQRLAIVPRGSSRHHSGRAGIERPPRRFGRASSARHRGPRSTLGPGTTAVAVLCPPASSSTGGSGDGSTALYRVTRSARSSRSISALSRARRRHGPHRRPRRVGRRPGIVTDRGRHRAGRRPPDRRCRRAHRRAAARRSRQRHGRRRADGGRWHSRSLSTTPVTVARVPAPGLAGGRNGQRRRRVERTAHGRRRTIGGRLDGDRSHVPLFGVALCWCSSPRGSSRSSRPADTPRSRLLSALRERTDRGRARLAARSGTNRSRLTLRAA